jgi:L-alanine-DL-glutamate epimerase-like enolase superfamily enzyme
VRIEEIVLRTVRVPLKQPYKLSYRTFTEFEPIIVEMRSRDGSIGWGEGHISPGSSSETREGGWRFCRKYAEEIVAREACDAMTIVSSVMQESKVAATALLTAIEMLEGEPLLGAGKEVRLPLLSPVNATDEAEIADEIEQRIEEGFRTFKIKVGSDAAADTNRVRAIQKAIDARATMRIDANRAYRESDAIAFVTALDPDGIELFEQPCEAEEWDANANVARVSPVPLMLDEPICALADIERAGQIDNVGFCKLKLKRFGGIRRLHEALDAVRAHGMEPVLGDGLGLDIACWMEAAVARTTIRNAGEFNGFLKASVSLLEEPIEFKGGDLILKPGFVPRIDRVALRAHEIAVERFSPVVISGAAQ